MNKKHPKKRKQVIVNVFGSKLQFFIRLVSWLLLTIVTVAFIALHVRFWMLDIYASYTPQVFLLAITLYILLAALYARFIIRDGWSKCWQSVGVKESLMFLTSTIFTFYILFNSLLVIKPVLANLISHNLTVGTYNVLYTNDDIYKAAYYFLSKDVGIIALQEAKPEFIQAAKDVLGYKYVEYTDCDCSAEDTEVAIISKYPLSNTETIDEHSNGTILRTEAKIDDDTTISVYAVHIPPPMNQEWYSKRNQFFDKLIISVKEDKHKSLVMGDFNTTIFSPVMKGFIKDTKYELENMSESVWPQCSWYGYGDVFCARIDHIYASRQFGIGNRFMGESFGSDHRPLIVQLLVN